MQNVIITGVSRGIGNALARLMLKKGCSVFGISRSIPQNCLRDPNFHYAAIDLSDLPRAAERLTQFLITQHRIEKTWRVFLNAGLFGGRVAQMKAIAVEDINYVMAVNVWANKVLLDVLLGAGVEIDSCVVSSSIAGVRARRGFNSYAISKAALNMMMKLYALENPEVFFAVLGLCFVDTRLSRQLLTAPLEGDFPESVALRERAKTDGYLVTPEQRALDIDALFSGNFREVITSGDFVEIRSLQSAIKIPS